MVPEGFCGPMWPIPMSKGADVLVPSNGCEQHSPFIMNTASQFKSEKVSEREHLLRFRRNTPSNVGKEDKQDYNKRWKPPEKGEGYQKEVQRIRDKAKRKSGQKRMNYSGLKETGLWEERNTCKDTNRRILDSLKRAIVNTPTHKKLEGKLRKHRRT